MKKSPVLKDNDIEILLNKENINREEDIDMYFKLVNFKILSKQHYLYLCTLKDKKSIYNNFIIKSGTQLLIDSIIHVTKIRITLSNNTKIISCLKYENFGKIQNEVNKKEIEEKEKEEREKREREILREELNDETKLLLGNLKHEKRKNKYFYKSDMGNIKLIDKKSNKEINLSVKKSPKKKEKKEKKEIDLNNNDISEEFQKKLVLKKKKKKKRKKKTIMMIKKK